MIFQTELTNIGGEISQLLAQVEAKKQRQSELLELDALTDSTLGQLGDVVSKIGHYAPDAIATLKSAVLRVFPDDGNNGSNGGNQPIEPTPEPDDDEPELLCLNGLTGECLTTADLDDEELPVDNPVGDEWVLPSDAPLTGQTCAIAPDIYWETTPPDGSSWEFASPLACLLWEDAPLLGQHCTISLSLSAEEDKVTPQPSSTEMIHTSARTGYLKFIPSGQILASYAWFPRKDLAIAWTDWLDGMNLGSPELRPSQRNLSWKYEVKLTGLSMTQIERLSGEDLSRKPSKKKETPAQAAGIEPPSDWGKVQPKENPPQLFAKVLLKDSEHYGLTLPVERVSANEIGYTLTLPSGDNHWYRADMVELVDAEIEEFASPTEPTQPEASTFEFGDVAEVIADLNDTHLIGSFGKVKFVKDNRIALEIDEQLAYFQPEELKLRSKAEEPKEQQLQSGQVLTGNRVVTTGAYFGTARRNAASMARMGTHEKVAQLQLMKDMHSAGLNPELAFAAATGTDDASDF
jgi:hypothetical protein